MKLMLDSNTTIRLCCFCYAYIADILSLYATDRFELQGLTPYETVMIPHLKFLNMHRFHDSSGRGSIMRDSKSNSYADG